MSDFSNAKVGDPVYHLDLGECDILEIGVSSDNITYFEISNGENKSIVRIDSKTIYQSKPTIIEAKRMVKKEVDVFVKTDYIEEITNRTSTCNFSFLFSTIEENNTTKCKLTFEVEE